MARENFCLQCEHVWNGLEADHCPECGSEDVSCDSDWEDGHFEGDMGNNKNYVNSLED